MLELSLIQKIAVFILPVLFAITVHEVAHGWVANRLGDPTARVLGRLTLNPIKHIDLFGTILVPAILLYLGGFVFGWAKPVPVDWKNLRRPLRDMALVAAAGPLANAAMALLWAFIGKLSQWLMPVLPSKSLELFLLMAQAGIVINFILLVLNLIPIPPLDGSRVVSSLLPAKPRYYYNRVEPYGFFILLLLMFTGVLTRVVAPLALLLSSLVFALFGLGG